MVKDRLIEWCCDEKTWSSVDREKTGVPLHRTNLMASSQSQCETAAEKEKQQKDVSKGCGRREKCWQSSSYPPLVCVYNSTRLAWRTTISRSMQNFSLSSASSAASPSQSRGSTTINVSLLTGHMEHFLSLYIYTYIMLKHVGMAVRKKQHAAKQGMMVCNNNMHNTT